MTPDIRWAASGGASNSGVIEIKDGVVTRIKKYADQ